MLILAVVDNFFYLKSKIAAVENYQLKFEFRISNFEFFLPIGCKKSFCRAIYYWLLFFLAQCFLLLSDIRYPAIDAFLLKKVKYIYKVLYVCPLWLNQGQAKKTNRKFCKTPKGD